MLSPGAFPGYNINLTHQAECVSMLVASQASEDSAQRQPGRGNPRTASVGCEAGLLGHHMGGLGGVCCSPGSLEAWVSLLE